MEYAEAHGNTAPATESAKEEETVEDAVDEAA
jgi:hypothetical protein